MVSAASTDATRAAGGKERGPSARNAAIAGLAVAMRVAMHVVRRGLQ